MRVHHKQNVNLFHNGSHLSDIKWRKKLYYSYDCIFEILFRILVHTNCIQSEFSRTNQKYFYFFHDQTFFNYCRVALIVFLIY